LRIGSKYRQLLKPILDSTKNYLKTAIKSSSLSSSELTAQNEKLNRQLSVLLEKFQKEKDTFNQEIADCIDEISNDVQCAVENEENTFLSLIITGQSINEQLNSTLRNALTSSVQRRFVPKVEKYLRRVSKGLQSENIESDFNFNISFNVEQVNKGMVSNIVASVAALLFEGTIVGIITLIGTFIVSLICNEKKKDEAKETARRKL